MLKQVVRVIDTLFSVHRAVQWAYHLTKPHHEPRPQGGMQNQPDSDAVTRVPN